MNTLARSGLDNLAQVIEIAPPETAAQLVGRLTELDTDGLDQLPGLLHAIAAAESVVIERRMELRRHLARIVERAVSDHGAATVRRVIGPTK